MMENIRIDMKDPVLWENFEFREILPEEAEAVAGVEQSCFPPNEACKPDIMVERVKVDTRSFVVAVEKATGHVVGFLNASATKEEKFRDEFFSNPYLHDPEGEISLILSLAVLPEYQGRGLAREIMFEFLRREQARGRRMAKLTCHEAKLGLYRKLGFVEEGMADSNWGGNATWVEMVHRLQTVDKAAGGEIR